MNRAEDLAAFFLACRLPAERIEAAKALFQWLDEATQLDRLPLRDDRDVNWVAYRRELAAGTGLEPSVICTVSASRFLHQLRRQQARRAFPMGPYGCTRLGHWEAWDELRKRHPDAAKAEGIAHSTFPHLHGLAIKAIPHTAEQVKTVTALVDETIVPAIYGSIKLFLAAASRRGVVFQRSTRTLVDDVLQNPPIRWIRGSNTLEVLVA